MSAFDLINRIFKKNCKSAYIETTLLTLYFRTYFLMFPMIDLLETLIFKEHIFISNFLFIAICLKLETHFFGLFLIAKKKKNRTLSL